MHLKRPLNVSETPNNLSPDIMWCPVVLDSQRAGGQVGVLVLQFSVQSEASFLSVVGQKRSEREHFAES